MLSCAHFGRAFDKLSQIYNISAEKYANREKKQNWKRTESDDRLNKEFKEVKEFREFSDYFANLTNFPNLLTQPSVEWRPTKTLYIRRSSLMCAVQIFSNILISWKK